MHQHVERLWAEAQPGDYIVDPPEELLDIDTIINARVILCNQLHNLYRSEPARFTAQHAVWRDEMAALYEQIDRITAELPDADWLAVRGMQ
ncbi:MAG TPA: hypothetical protein VFU31_22140 [Candidatus Binatia bacterium]|nr:hypothetical protein [Candidatus Binatia bacterium]